MADNIIEGTYEEGVNGWNENEVIEGKVEYGINAWKNTEEEIRDFKSKIKRLSNKDTIKLCPLWAYLKGGEDKIKNTLALPVSPSDMMFTCDSNSTTLNLMNYGELPTNMNRKLATWSVISFFPEQKNSEYYTNEDGQLTTRRNRYWFDLSNDNGQGNYDTFGDYCRILYDWKVEQTPLVYIYDTWGDYYYCQIKTFKYGRKDATKNVYYELNFQEYKKYDRFEYSYESVNYDSDTYIVQPGETVLSIAKKLWGSSEYFQYLLELNNFPNPEKIQPGMAIKVK